MGQHHSTGGDSAYSTTATDRKIREGDSMEAGGGQLNAVWRKSVGAMVTSLPHHGELGPADISSPASSSSSSSSSSASNRARMEGGEVSRMSIRAAIDSFIENCLSAPTDDLVIERPNSDSPVVNETKGTPDSSLPKTSLSENNCKNELNNVDFEDGSKSDSQDVKDEVSNKQGKEEIADCAGRMSREENGNDDVLEKPRENTCDGDSLRPCVNAHKEEVNARGDEQTDRHQKESEKDNSAETSSNSVDRQIQPPGRCEKKSFSAYLQDKLKRVDFDKHEELSQLVLSKDIKCQEQMIMWEAKKPPTPSESSAALCESGRSSLITESVRLQTLIDRVLDSSLNNRNSAPVAGHRCGSQVSSAAATQVVGGDAAMLVGLSKVDPSDTQHWKSSMENTASAPNEKRLSFKNHIEKVLVESFLSYEEDERKESLKRKENMSNGSSAVVISEPQTSVKECSISVQDIVDQVISQTEMISKLLTPSTRDTSKSASSPVHTDKVKTSLTLTGESGQKTYVASVSPQSRSLIEAQRHLVQKEHQSSTSLSRKRGRPQMNATGSSSNCAIELTRDPHHSGRIHEGKMNQTTMVNQYQTKASPLNYASKSSLQYSVPVNMASLASHSSSSSAPQGRHYNSDNSRDLPSALRLPQVAIDYHSHPREAFHQQAEGQHLSTQAYHQSYSQLPQPPHASLLPTSTAPPPLILADQVKTSMSTISQVAHTPTSSCSCQVCRSHFSQGQAQFTYTQQSPHPFTSQDKAGQSAIHPSQSAIHQSLSAIHLSQSSTHPGQFSIHPSQSAIHPSQSAIHSSQPAIHPSQSAIHPSQSAIHHSQSSIHSSHPSIHHSSLSGYKSSIKNFKDVYPHPASATRGIGLPVLPATVQGMPPVVIAAQNHAHHSLPSTMEVSPTGRSLDSDLLSSRHHHHHYPARDLVTVMDSKLPGAHHQMPKMRAQLDSHEDDVQRLTRDRTSHLDRAEDFKAHSAGACPQVATDTEQPLDLSVKPGPTIRQEKRTQDHAADHVRQGTWEQDRTSPYRPTLCDRLGVTSNDQCVVSEQAASSGHHLQWLEKSVSKILPLGPAQCQTREPGHVQTVHVPLHNVKGGSHPAPQHEAQLGGRGGGQHDLTFTESCDSRTNLLLSRSPVTYSQVVADLPQPHPGQAHNPRKLAPSPSRWSYQVTSPSCAGLGPGGSDGQLNPVEAESPTVLQRPSSQDPELKHKATPGTSAAFVSALILPQKSPSPDDSEGPSFGISKHEPIQNIIGSHSPTDILYLICRLCRQTYGSPYGFRKHFRNQHGFEPKADHTIVQTISATKTALAHTEHYNPLEDTVAPVLSKHEKSVDNSNILGESPAAYPVDNVTTLSQSEDSQLDIKKEMDIKKEVDTKREMDVKKEVDTKYLECPECRQAFQLNDFGSYKRHCRQHNVHRNSGPFACHDCHTSFADPQQLREHLLSHRSLTSSSCDTCHAFSSPDCLAEHLHTTHGQSLSNEEVRSLPHSDICVGNRLVNQIQPVEHLLQQRNQAHSPGKTSGCCHPELVPSSLPSTKFAGAQSTAQELTKKPLSSASHHQPISKPSQWSKPLLTEAHMFTVHTPKDLEVEKLPADGVVTTASPDSSYDDAKFHMVSQPVSSTSHSARRSTEAAASSSRIDTVNNDNSELTANSISTVRKNKKSISNSSILENKESIGNSSDQESKDSVIFYPQKENENFNSVDSKSATSEAPHYSSEVHEASTFYRHKKYGRHWKRHSPSDGDEEPTTKSAKTEMTDLVHRSQYSVSSSVNSSVSIQVCQSSSPNLSESSPLPNQHLQDEKDLESQRREEQVSQSPGHQKRSEKADRNCKKAGFGGSGVNEVAAKLKWDRQTRSQTGKVSQTSQNV